MADKTGIEWADATWNPIVGCSIVSPGCTNCYAMKMADRVANMMEIKHHDGRKAGVARGHYAGLTQPSKAGPVWTGKLALAPDHILTQPLRWKKGRFIFVNSMGDLFHENICDQWIDKVFAIMALAPQHTFLVLTKRAKRMQHYIAEVSGRGEAPRRWLRQPSILTPGEMVFDDLIKTRGTHVGWPLPHVWLGVSTERQAEADARIPLLLATPAAKRFISAEPLLGPINLNRIHETGEMSGGGDWHSWESALNGKRFDIWSDGEIEGCPKLDWVIAGGESGKDARPMHPDWARGLRDQCAAAGVPFFFKQWGDWTPGVNVDADPGVRRLVTGAIYGPWEGGLEWAFSVEDLGDEHAHIDDEPDLYRVGKVRAGRLLDGVEHSERPQP